MTDEMMNIPAEKFKFTHEHVKLGDKKLQTKPISYLHDAWNRFAKNKSSIVGMVIILLLLLFSFFAPLFSNYSVSDTNLYYQNVAPKISAHATGGFWDGSRKVSTGAASYYYNLAMGVESGRETVTKLYSIEETSDGTTLYTYRQDTYNAVGYEFLNLTEDAYKALQEYQNETGIQVIYPMPITTAQGSGKVMYDVNDANYWYRTYLTGSHRGEPVLDEDGNFQTIYRTSGTDNYNSLRIDGDPGKTDPEASDRYRYALINQTGYRVRVCYYDYYIYLNGFEPCYLFGANASGQDLFVCVASGTRFSFFLAICVAAINLLIGAVYGSIEGFYGGKIDLIMERISDIMSGIPFMVVAILFNMHLAATVGTVGALIFAFVLTGWIGTASTVRMQFYRFKKQEYVLAARTLGARDRRLIVKHIFPNALGTIITSAALYIPSVILSETSLTYLGIISLDNPANGLTSLGTLLSAGQASLSNYPHIILFPALVIALLMISFNLFGNGLRDAFNPSLRGSDS